MKTKAFWLVALLAAGVLTLAGCGKNETPVENPDENAEIANPASVYCEENGWTFQLEEGAWLCMFSDGTYCEEWAFMNGECQPGEITYNTVSEEAISGEIVSEPTIAGSNLYSEEDLAAAEAAILDMVINEWEVKVEGFETTYAGDETASNNLEYCLRMNPEVVDCAVFTSSFHIPEQDVQMAGGFEPNADITGYSWYLGRANAGEWEVLTNGFG